MATNILLFATGSIQELNNEALITPDFAGDLLSYKRDAPLEMPSQYQDRSVNNMNMGDQNMMSKYSQPNLTSRLKKRFLLVAFLTLVMASTTASPVSVRPSSAQEPRSTDQLQQTLNDELPSSGAPEYAPEVSRQTVKIGEVFLASSSPVQGGIIPYLTASPGANEAWISLPFNTKAISVWMTERTSSAAGVRSHAGGAVISTSSVQLSQQGSSVRVRYHSNWNSTLPVLAMVIATNSVTGQTSGFVLDRRF